MNPFKVVILPHGYPSTDLEQQIIRQAGGSVVDGDQLPSEADALREAEDADAILVRWTKITPEHIRRFRRCRIIVRYGIGYDNVDYDAATAAGIIIGHCTDYCVDEVATHALSLLLACVRDVVGTHQRVNAGGWSANPPVRQRRMAGSTLGIIGLGNIGRTVARKLGGWNLRLMAVDPYVSPEEAARLGVRLVDLPTLCRESDYISLHAPLLPETHHLIGRRELAWMKPDVMLINTARGPLIDVVALGEALAGDHLAAVGLDVFETEPWTPGSPLLQHPRVIVSDHAAWYSEDSLRELKKSVAEEAVRVCTGGLPIAIANPEVLHKLGRFHEWTPNYNAQWRAKRAASATAQTLA